MEAFKEATFAANVEFNEATLETTAALSLASFADASEIEEERET